MKKSVIFALLLVLMPLVSAVQISLNPSYNQGETLLAQISGNFLDQIQQQNVLLYSGHVRVSFIPTVQKFGDSFYVYGQLQGKPQGNYSLVISGVRYSESGATLSDDISKNFTITNSSADFSVSPGIIESQGAFTVNVQNLVDNSVSVEYFLSNSSDSASSSGIFSIFHSSDSGAQITTPATVSVSSGKTVPLSFSIPSGSYQLIYAVVQTNNTFYQIPVYIPPNSTSTIFLPPLSFQPQQNTVSMPTNSNLSYHVSLVNSGSSDQTVNLSVSDNLKNYVSFPPSVVIAANSTNSILINIISTSGNNLINGQIIASSPNSTAFFSLTLNFTQGYVAPANASLFQNCNEMGGIFCNDSSNCDVATQNAEDGICCVGNCVPINNNNSGAIVGWILAIIIIGFVAFFFIRRYMKAKRKPMNLLDFAKKKI